MKSNRSRSRLIAIITSIFALALLSACQTQPAIDQPFITTDNLAIALDAIATPSLDLPSITADETLAQAVHTDQQPLLTIWDQTTARPAESLDNQLPNQPQRQIYVLTPDHQYQLQLHFTCQTEHTDFFRTNFHGSYTNSLPDTKVGTIRMTRVEVFPDQTIHNADDYVLFVADNPAGITLSVDLDSFSYDANSASVALHVRSGQVDNWHYDTDNRQEGDNLIEFTGYDYITLDPETNADSINRYLYPQGLPTELQPTLD